MAYWSHIFSIHFTEPTHLPVFLVVAEIGISRHWITNISGWSWEFESCMTGYGCAVYNWWKFRVCRGAWDDQILSSSNTTYVSRLFILSVLLYKSVSNVSKVLDTTLIYRGLSRLSTGTEPELGRFLTQFPSFPILRLRSHTRLFKKKPGSNTIQVSFVTQQNSQMSGFYMNFPQIPCKIKWLRRLPSLYFSWSDGVHVCTCSLFF